MTKTIIMIIILLSPSRRRKEASNDGVAWWADEPGRQRAVWGEKQKCEKNDLEGSRSI